MPYWESLGRTVIAHDTQDNIGELCRELSYAGIDACMSPDSMDDTESREAMFSLAVPNDEAPRAKKLIGEMNSEHLKKAAEYRSGLEHSPIFTKAEEKFKDVTDSAFFFLICGGAVFLISLFQWSMFLLKSHARPPILTWIELLIGTIFFAFGFYTMRKARNVRRNIAEENAFTLRVIEWCLSTYPPSEIDRTISSAISAENGSDPDKNWAAFLPPSILMMHRRDLIRTYINREFSVDDEAYMRHIVNEVYVSMFETRTLRDRTL